jgi:hypothetical protein
MTTATDTVLSVQVAELTPEPVVKADPARCAEGAKIHRDWAMAVNAAPMGKWEIIMGKGYLVYIEHWMQCSECGEYELFVGHVKAKGEK